MGKKNTEKKANVHISLDTVDTSHKVSIEQPGENSTSHQLIERSGQRRIDKKLIRSKSFGDPVEPKDFLSIQKRIESIMSLDDLRYGMVIAPSQTAQVSIWY